MNSNTLIFIKPFFIFLIISLFLGCASSKNINYFQENKNIVLNDTIINYEPVIQFSDMLTINVSSAEPEAAVPFNIFEVQANGFARPLPYMVNADGNINFPTLGKIKVAQLTQKEVTNKLYSLLLPYLNNPIITVQLINFKVSILGEVRNPGSYTILNERINILEAIALAGDLTIYGKRKTVLLIREQNGKREYIPIDLTKKDLFNSSYYYLTQNDIIYVEANKTRVNSAAVGPNTSIIVSSLSILISLAAILIN